MAFLRKGVLKIRSKFTGEMPCRSAISVKLQNNFWVAASECCKLGARRFLPYDPKIIGDIPKNVQKASTSHCVKSARIRSYSGPHFYPHFPAFRLNTERISPYSVRMREIAGKMRTRITPNTDTFYEVSV